MRKISSRQAWRKARRAAVGLVAVAAAAAVTAPAAAGATAALGRWSGGGKGGRIFFAVHKVRHRLMLTDVVVACPDGGSSADHPGGTPGRAEAVITPGGRIVMAAEPSDPRIPTNILVGFHGTLHGRHGTVTANPRDFVGPMAGAPHCTRRALHHVHVAPIHARALTDGIYKLTGPLYTSGEFGVWGEGAMIEWSANFATPFGWVDPEDPAINCASEESTSSFGNGTLGADDPHTIYPNAAGKFLMMAHGEFGDFVSFNGTFTSRRAAKGTYSAAIVYPEQCGGTGAIKLTLVHPLHRPLALARGEGGGG